MAQIYELEEINAEYAGKLIRSISREGEGVKIEFHDGTALLIELKAEEDFAPINGFLEITSIYL